MNKKKHSQAGQAVIEMCVCVTAILIVFLGLIFVGGLGISNMQDLIKAKTSVETNSSSSDKSWDNDDIFSWDYRSQQQQQRQAAEPDFFPGSHLFYVNRGGNINPFSANDRAIINNANTGNTNPAAPPVPSDFQSTFLRELSPANQAKKNESAANSIFCNIPPLFVGAEEMTGSQAPDESAFSGAIENQEAGEAKQQVNKNVKSGAGVKSAGEK
jgi:hypothetical protein